jgi:hypothetical protein
MNLFRSVRRDSAERYLSIVLLSFAASVGLTRLFLSLTGYPQIGGGELHIAHALWGGFLLFIAALLPLIIANRWVYTTSAALTGIGVGLFIDEVGKFITQRNDYFYPAAAPIVYTFFLLTILLFLNIRRAANTTPNAELHKALEQIQDALVEPVKPQEYQLLESHLERIANESTSIKHTELARALLKFVQEDALSVPSTQTKPNYWISHLTRKVTVRLLSDDFLRLSLITGISAIGLLTLKNPIQVLFAKWLPPAVDIFLKSLYSGRHIDAAALPFWFDIRLVLELIVGSLLLISSGLLIAKRTREGARLAYVALLLSLTTVNLLLFYFEQFSTIMTTLIQFVLLLEIVYYQRRLIKPQS